MDNENEKKLKEYAKDCVETLACQVNSIVVQKDAGNFETNFSQPKDRYHVTTLYLGGKKGDSPLFQNFKSGDKLKVKV